MQDTGKRRNVRANKSVSGEETIVASKVKRKYRLRTCRTVVFVSRRASVLSTRIATSTRRTRGLLPH